MTEYREEGFREHVICVSGNLFSIFFRSNSYCFIPGVYTAADTDVVPDPVYDDIRRFTDFDIIQLYG